MCCCTKYLNAFFRKYIFRRKDAPVKMIKKYQLPDINMSYFISAMDQYVQHFKRENSSSRVSTELWSIDIGVHVKVSRNYMYLKHSNHRFQLIFIFVSDDMEWVRKHMRRKIKKEFNIFLASNKDDMHPDAIGNMLYSITLSRII